MKWKTDNRRTKNKIYKFKYLEARATGNHLNPINLASLALMKTL